jgi:hypothetical protein
MEVKTIDQKQQIFVKIFEGTSESVEDQINDWLLENGRKIEIDAQNTTSSVVGQVIYIVVVFRFMWINR